MIRLLRSPAYHARMIEFGRKLNPPHRRRERRARRLRSAFSLIELLVVIGIVVILFSIFVPYAWRMREESRRTGCANNLRALFGALKQYADDNGKLYPQSAADPVERGRYVSFTGAAAIPETLAGSTRPTTAPAETAPATAPAGSPAIGPTIAVSPPPATGPTTGPTVAEGPTTRPAIALPPRPRPDAVQYNDVTASLWLLVRVAPSNPTSTAVAESQFGYANPAWFVCPSGDETPDPMLTGGRRMRPDQRSNFTSGRHLSYSYASPFSGYVDPSGQPFRMNSDKLHYDFALMADKNPGVSPANGDDVTAPAYNADARAFMTANSHNHGRAGQNVLYAIGEVRFQKTPYCGVGTTWQRDNIYTAYSATPYLPAPVKDGDKSSSPPAVERNGVFGPHVGPAWEKDSYLVPSDDE
jgi:prepilin-type N-terminal cleavage/methylation domain-containing protein